MKYLFPALFSFGFLVPAASPAATVDAGLRAATGRIRVIAIFKDRLRPVRSLQAGRSYLSVRRHLAANAKESQKGFLETIGGRAGLTEGIRARSLWIVNAAIVDLPADQLSVLENHPDIAAIREDRQVRGFHDWSEKPLKPAAETDAAYTYGLNAIRLPRLRAEEPRADGKGILVGVLDSGVDAKHADLRGKVVGWKDFVDGQEQPHDENGHGTHVAGTIAGGNASGQHVGVAPGAKLLVGRILDRRGFLTTSSALDGMQWIADPDGKPESGDEPSLVSNSWAVSGSADGDPATNPYCKAVDAWVDLGIFPVFAAGNSGPGEGTIRLPAACPNAFAVGATDEKDALADFSSRGPVHWKTRTLVKPEISAPGVAILSAWPGGGHKSLSGTSMAAPHVAGLLALLYQLRPTLAIRDAADLLSRTAKDLGQPGHDPEFGRGRIDAFETMSATRRQALRR